MVMQAPAAPVLGVPGCGVLQRRLAVGSTNDPLEREAERRAAEIVRTPAPSMQRELPDPDGPALRRVCARCEEEEASLQREAFGMAPAIAPAVVPQALAQTGTPLSAGIRAFMEPRFAADFSGVRVHTDRTAGQSATAVNARAYTVGQDIVFATGAYSPDTLSGQTLIAHELTHVLQQRSGLGRVQRQAEPAGGEQRSTSVVSTAALDTALRTVRTASLVVPGLAPLVPMFELIGAAVYFWDHRHEHLQQLLDSIGTAVESVPAMARAKLNEFLASAGTAAEAGACVGDQLFVLLESLAQHWRAVLQSFIRDLVFVGLFERSLPTIIDNVWLLMDDISNGEYRSAIDRSVAIMTEINAIAGVLFLWYALITTVVGAAAGSEVPVAGNAVGAAAGMTLAQVVNIGLVASVVVTEAARVGRGIDDMSRFWDDVVAREAGCRQVAEGVFALALTAALFYLGPGIQSVARSIISRATVAVRRAVTAVTREASAALETLTAPRGVVTTPDGLVVPFAGPEPRVSPRPPTRIPPRTTPPPIAEPPTTPAPAESRPAPTPAAKTSEPSGTPTPALSPAPSSAPSTKPSVKPSAATATEDPRRRVPCDTLPRSCPSPLDGLRPDCPLPFTWYKPQELYASLIELPNADPPVELGREKAPRVIYYRSGRRRASERLGVAKWPKLCDSFQFIPYDERGTTPNQRRFNTVLDALGFDRSGFDAEHVWDVYLRGLDYDRFNNLWPASNQEQQLAGTRHRNQIVDYQATLGNLVGRWFRIVEFRHPA